MKNNVKVSVVVPVYNGEDCIRDTAKCIMNQSLKEIEIIFVDDGSKDQTVQILEEMKRDDNRIQIYCQQNQYAGVARNTGASHATGDYIVFWDADDIFLPEALEKLYLKITEDDADICFCPADYYDNITGKVIKNNVYIKYDLTPTHAPFTRDEVSQYLFNFCTNVPWNKMYRRKMIVDNGLEFQSIKRANDNYFVMTAFYNAKTFTYINEPVIQYRINREGSLVGSVSKDPLCVYEAYKKTYEYLQSKDDFNQIKQSFLNKTARSCFYFLSQHTEFAAYETLYNCFKDNVFNKWDFPENKEYYYVEKDYVRLIDLKNMPAIEFLMKEYNSSINSVRKLKSTKMDLSNKLKAVRESRDRLKIKKDDLKLKNDELKEKNNRLTKKVEELENSTSYRVGKAITFVPRKIKGNK